MQRVMPLLAAYILLAACRPPPDEKCGLDDGCGGDEYCTFRPGFEPLESGNPSPLPGFLSDSYECRRLPSQCADTPTCDCLTCADGEPNCPADDDTCFCENFASTCDQTSDGGLIVTYPKE
jgi:hypothetical protein